MKIVIPGGTGHRGAAVAKYWRESGHEVIIATRKPNGPNEVLWDGVGLGPWALEVDGADIVFNLAGRTVNCRYTPENLQQMMDSRVLSTRAVAMAIQQAKNPPKLWLQMSTATIYAHRFDAANDEATGIIGGNESGAPPKWVASINIAKAWEAELAKADTPRTRKVAVRASMVMGPEKDGVFQTLAKLAKRGFAGRAGNGKQYISWIHEDDFHRAIDFIVNHQEMDGAINVASPNPLPNKEFNQILRETVGVKIGLPAAEWMLELGARAMRTETELILKSRRVVSGRLRDAGFKFEFPDWPSACRELART